MLPNQFIEEVEKLKHERPDHEVVVRIKQTHGDFVVKIKNVVIGHYGIELVCEPV